MDPNFGAQLDQTYNRLRTGLKTKKRGYEWRMEQLRALKRLLVENDQALNEAMWKDLRKNTFECMATEQGVVLGEIEVTLKKLSSWMRPRRVSTPIYNMPGRCHIVQEPYGLTLIIGAWNYPINLLLAPLVGAIAGGNGAIIKPSEISANTASLVAQLVPKYMDPDLFAVVLGGADETDVLLDKTFELIFFTGSGTVGKIVLAKAAPKLTPTVLELGGKSPAIVLADADIEVSARRIAWGKFMNAGQTCVAPDYVLIHPSVKERFVAELKKTLQEFYGATPETHPDYCRIVNQRNFDRLAKLTSGVQVLHGGKMLREQLYIEPTIVSATADAPIMQEEIFGPILPLIEISDREQIAEFIRSRPHPLAFYLFTRDGDQVSFFVDNTSAGGVCVNDVVMHLPVPSLPFGGVGASGMGNYHGEFSFKTFTHAKGVLRKTTWPDFGFRYPPYNKEKARWMKWIFG